MNITELKTKFNIKRKKISLNIEDLAFHVSIMITEARVKSGLTQAQLAKRMGTRQPSIARVENRGVLPSLEFLQKMAKALGTDLTPPTFDFLKTETLKNESINHANSITGEYTFYFPFKVKAPDKEVVSSNEISTGVKEFSHQVPISLR